MPEEICNKMYIAFHTIPILCAPTAENFLTTKPNAMNPYQ